jgi:hypothetical protein
MATGYGGSRRRVEHHGFSNRSPFVYFSLPGYGTTRPYDSAGRPRSGDSGSRLEYAIYSGKLDAQIICNAGNDRCHTYLDRY